MTGYESKRAVAQDKLTQPAQEPWPEEPFGHMAGGVQPPQRTWVGLTENEIEVIEVMALTKAWAIRMTMAQLKERNT